MLQSNKRHQCQNKFLGILTFLFLVCTTAHAAQSCADTNTQYIIGGINKVDDKAALAVPQNDSKCFISEVDTLAKSNTTKTLKIDKTIKLDRAISPVAIKVNLYDKKTVEDRNFILNAELRKAILLKEDLSNKKSNGQAVDASQLSRLDADITAIKNELSR